MTILILLLLECVNLTFDIYFFSSIPSRHWYPMHPVTDSVHLFLHLHFQTLNWLYRSVWSFFLCFMFYTHSSWYNECQISSTINARECECVFVCNHRTATPQRNLFIGLFKFISRPAWHQNWTSNQTKDFFDLFETSANWACIYVYIYIHVLRRRTLRWCKNEFRPKRNISLLMLLLKTFFLKLCFLRKEGVLCSVNITAILCNSGFLSHIPASFWSDILWCNFLFKRPTNSTLKQLFPRYPGRVVCNFVLERTAYVHGYVGGKNIHAFHSVSCLK